MRKTGGLCVSRGLQGRCVTQQPFGEDPTTQRLWRNRGEDLLGGEIFISRINPASRGARSTGVGVVYVRWRSAQACEKERPWMSNACTVVQRLYPTLTPAVERVGAHDQTVAAFALVRRLKGMREWVGCPSHDLAEVVLSPEGAQPCAGGPAQASRRQQSRANGWVMRILRDTGRTASAPSEFAEAGPLERC